MFVDLQPAVVELSPGGTAYMTVRITNASSVIDAYTVSLFGLDQEWVATDRPRISLFPSESDVVDLSITLPEGFPAGARQLSVHVQSGNDPGEFALTPVTLVVVPRPRLSLRMDPVMVTGGSEASFGMVVTNTGNTTVLATADGIDPEDKSEIAFLPGSVDLPPGHQETIRVDVKARRPWFGQPKVRTYTFAVEAHQRTEAVATFIQKPRIARGVLSLLGLLTAAAVFAAVLSRTFDNVVDQAAIDQRVLSAALDQGAQNENPVPVDPGGLAGTVELFTTGDPVAGVQADLFRADATQVPIATAATNDQGAYSFGGLAAGEYVVRFSGAGFGEIWYLDGNTAADATAVEVQLGSVEPLDAVRLGGRPGSVAGSVDADDPTGAVATLLVPGQIDEGTDAAVQSVDVDANGEFFFETVPSPASYQLVIEKPGYASATRDVVLLPAEDVRGIEMALRRGDGVIRGSVSTGTGAGAVSPLGGATIEASDGSTVISTVSLTEDSIGSFVLRGLPTPAVYTLTITREGYRTETRTVNVPSPTESAPEVGPIDVQLQRATGSLAGTVSLAGEGALGGVTVTISGGEADVTTISATTGAVGQWFVDGLDMPATYTITFSRPGYVSQTRLQDLDPSRGAIDVAGIDVSMVRQNGVVRGVVRGVGGQPVARATVSLTDGTTTRTVLTADDPLGRFDLSGVAPGAYTMTVSLTGATPSVLLVNLAPSEVTELDVQLEAQASLFGSVEVFSDDANDYVPFEGAVVRLFLPGNFPGPAESAVAEFTVGADGTFAFLALEAPQDYVIAVYSNATNPNALDSRLVLTQPSTALEVTPPFRIAEVS